MNLLRLRIKRKWFNLILAGEKTKEYRAFVPFYHSRLRNGRYDVVEFYVGNVSSASRCRVVLLGVTVEQSPFSLFCYPVYVLYLGERL